MIGWNSCSDWSKFPLHCLSGTLLYEGTHMRKLEVLGLSSYFPFNCVSSNFTYYYIQMYHDYFYALKFTVWLVKNAKWSLKVVSEWHSSFFCSRFLGFIWHFDTFYDLACKKQFDIFNSGCFYSSTLNILQILNSKLKNKKLCLFSIHKFIFIHLTGWRPFWKSGGGRKGGN